MISSEDNRRVSRSPAFYVTGGTVPRDAPCYVHRKADDDLYERLSAGDFCYVLTARQLGKSSLMVRTASRLREDGTLCIILDLTAIGHNVDVSHWYAGLVNQVGQHAGLEDEIDDYWLASSPLGPMQRWMHALQHIVLKNTTGPVVVFVDEIDAIRSLPFSADEFFAGIRECYNRRTTEPELNRLSFCLLGVATPSDLIKDTRITPFNIGSRIELTDFTPVESRQLIAGLVDRSPDSTPQQIDSILDRVLYWSGGHPYLTQRLFKSIADHPANASAGAVDSICQDLFFSSRSRERDDNLHFVRDRLVRSEADTFALLELYRKVRAGRSVPDDEANRLINVLRLSGIIRINNGRLLVRNRIYSTVFDLAWIADNMPDVEVRRQRTAYRRGVVRTTAVAGAITLLMTLLAVYAGYQKHVADHNSMIATRNEKAAQLSAKQANANADLAMRNAKERDLALREALLRKQAAVASATAAQVQATRAKQLEGSALALAHRASIAESKAQGAARRARDEAELKARYLYIADLNILGQAWDSNNGVPMDRVDEILAETSKSKLRGFEWGYWNRLAHRYLASFEPHSGWIYSADFSPDGKRVSAAGDDGTVRIWDIGTNRCVKTIPTHSNVHGVAFSQDGDKVVTSGNTGLVQVWNCNSGVPVTTMKLSYFPTKSIFLCKDTRILGWGMDKSPVLWDSATGHKLATMIGHTGEVTDAVYCASKGSIITGSMDGSVKKWNAETGAFETTLFKSARPIFYISMNRSGTMLITSDTHIVSVVDLPSGTVRGSFPIGEGAVSGAISPDGETVAISDFNGVINIEDAHTLTPIRALHGHIGRVFSLSFSRDGHRLCSAGEDGTTRVWDLDSTSDVGYLSEGMNAPYTAAWSPDGARMAVGCADGLAGIWTVATGKPVFNHKFHPSYIRAIGWNRDGSKLITCDDSGKVVTTVAATGEQYGAFSIVTPNTGSASIVSISHDARYVFVNYSDEATRCWSVATGRKVMDLPSYKVGRARAAFMPDSRFMLLASNHQMTLWDLSVGAAIKVWPNTQYAPISMDISRDGKHVVTLNGWTATVFNVTPKGLILDRILRGHMGKSSNVSFSPDGSRILFSGSGAAVGLWDTNTGRELLNIPNNNKSINASFSPDGTRIAAPCSYGVQIWYGTGR